MTCVSMAIFECLNAYPWLYGYLNSFYKVIYEIIWVYVCACFHDYTLSHSTE